MDKISTMYRCTLWPPVCHPQLDHEPQIILITILDLKFSKVGWEEWQADDRRLHPPSCGHTLQSPVLVCGGGAWSDFCCSLCLYGSIRKPEHWRNKWSLQPANFSIRTHGKLHSARALYCAARRCKNWTLGNMMERRNLDIVPLLLGRTRIWAKNWLLWVLLLSIRLK